MVRIMKEVTDPELLAQLNGIDNAGLKEVTDPEILAQLGDIKPSNEYKFPTSAMQVINAIQPGTRDKARTVLDQGLQGLPLVGTFADEATGAIGGAIAPALAALQGKEGLQFSPIRERMQQGVDLSQNNVKTQQQKYPLLSLGSQVAGGGLASGAAATTKSGQAIINSLGNSGFLGRTAKGGALGAITGAAYDAGNNEGSFTDRIKQSGNGAIYGGIAGAATPIAAAGINAVKNAVILCLIHLSI